MYFVDFIRAFIDKMNIIIYVKSKCQLKKNVLLYIL